MKGDKERKGKAKESEEKKGVGGHRKQEMRGWIFVIIVCGIAAIGVWLILPVGNSPEDSVVAPDANTNLTEAELMDFADCLAQHNFTVFYSDNCGACEVQQKMFGVAFTNLSSINCGEVNCSALSIHAVPTWIAFDQREYNEGVLTIQELAEWSGCEVRGGKE